MRLPESESGPEVVVGVDGSSAAFAAVEYGLRVAAELGSHLRLVHAVPTLGPVRPLGPIDPDRAYALGSALLLDLTRRARLVAPSVDVRTTLQQGAVVPVLVEASGNAVLVVVGRRVGGGPLHLLTGTVAAGVTKRTLTPVTVVPGDWRPGTSSKDVVVGLKDPATGAALLASGLEHAGRTGGALVILHAWQVPVGYEDLVSESQAQAWSAELRGQVVRSTSALCLSFPEVPVQVRVVHDSPVNALLKASTEAGIVLVGRRPSTGSWVHLGSVPRALQRAARCPLEVSPVDAGPGAGGDIALARGVALLG